ncbi:hypothetical protein JOD43_000654 [Pullulanibacillus pueri]|uniref:Uncharacterized protein n=1 Tax=Pullulanibacillus pueri TaxID=1437324 RepID=A0A8J3EMW1_9BACL|nr:hypothetical protein [Pullulanibacillus pueri]MBM7680492.1 hypothetical protein [Pullulanibacillus pueri]GGH86017.1 hypothetical protein GCM10007096_32740 [Pullulanibacillus pueri]
MSHTTLRQRHKERNQCVREFHKEHEFKIQFGENGNSLLAKWERFFYKKIILPLKDVK